MEQSFSKKANVQQRFVDQTKWRTYKIYFSCDPVLNIKFVYLFRILSFA